VSRQIHQVVVSAAPGDAITNAALEWRSLLRRAGASEIFACYRDDALVGEVFPVEAYEELPSAASGDNLLLLHASIGDPRLHEFLEARRERLVLMYHNITPPEYFQPFAPHFAELLTDGRRELKAVRDRVVLALAASPYNARELDDLGYERVRVTRLVVEPARLRAVEPNPALVEELRRRHDGPVFLFIGQLLPHKRPDLLIEAFHVLSTYHRPDATLFLVGAPRIESYQRAIRRLVRELSLPNVRLVGAVSDERLVAYLRRADGFVTATEHEGVCLPLLEAMAFEVPVLARDFAAVPDTLGGAGLLLPRHSGPLLIAEAMLELAGNDALRAQLVARGQRRLGDFEPEPARADFLAAIDEVR
jgi:glycosyltransferase involved in cell wall biosynthesis